MSDCKCSKENDVKCTKGWRVWYDDGTVYDSRKTKWNDLPDTKLLIRIIYNCDGSRSIQTADWYYEAPHPKGIIRASCSDLEQPRIAKEHPEAVFKRGFWTVDEWFYKLKQEAWDLAW